MKDNRIAWIDMAKGYGMLLVIIGHLNWQYPYIRVLIYSFHLPLFFFLSGYVFDPKGSFLFFLKKKMKSMVIPYFCLGFVIILYLLLVDSVHGEFSISSAFSLLKELIIQRRFCSIWFITVIFLLNILFFPLARACSNDWMLLAISVVLTTLGFVFYFRIGYYYGCSVLPWNIDAVFPASIFFCLGYFYKKHVTEIGFFCNKAAKGSIRFVLYTIINISCALLSYSISGYQVSMAEVTYGVLPLFFISAFTGIMAVIIATKKINITIVRYIGENSILFLAWHQTIMISVVCTVLNKIGIPNGEDSSIIIGSLYRIVVFILIVLFCTVCNVLIDNSKLRFIIGKKCFSDEEQDSSLQKRIN